MRLWPLALLICCCLVAMGQEADWGEDDEGFINMPSSQSDTPTKFLPLDEKSLAKNIRWRLRSQYGLWTRRLYSYPLAQARQNIDVTIHKKVGRWVFHGEAHGEYDLAYRHHASRFKEATKDVYQQQLYIREGYGSYTFAQLDFTFGRQIIANGMVNLDSVLDVLNPLDMRTPGISEIDDLKMGLLMSKMGYFWGDHALELIVVHEASFGLRSPPVGPYGPLNGLVKDSLLPSPAKERILGADIDFQHVPQQFSPDNQSGLLRMTTHYPAVDLAVCVGSILDSAGVLVPLSPTQLLQVGAFTMAIDHPRYTLVGLSLSHPHDNFVFSLDAGYFRDFMVMTRGYFAPQLFAAQKTDIWASSGGIRWEKAGLGSIVGQIKKKWLKRRIVPLMTLDKPEILVRLQKKYQLERITASVMAGIFGVHAEQGAYYRVEIDYAVDDQMQLKITSIAYSPGEQTGWLNGFDQHDQLGMAIRYDF